SSARSTSPARSTSTSSGSTPNSRSPEGSGPFRHPPTRGRRAMLQVTLHKIAAVVGTLLGIAILTFVITNVAPGDAARLVAGPNATEDMVQTIRREYGLDRSLPEQFVIYMGDLVRGDLGTSVITTRPVLDELLRYAPATL